jgi:SAM-dependent methyltransferase
VGDAASVVAAMRQLLRSDVPDVSTQLSPDERMPKAHREHYFGVGQSAIRFIRLALLAAGKTDVASILDFACGHGRVLRTLRAAFPGAQLTACDLLPDGVDFCARAFRAVPVYSNPRPSAALFAGRRFDLVFCGSLLTHVDAPRWSDLLELFDTVLAPGGLLVFTVQGPFVAHRMRSGELYGYGAAPMTGRWATLLHRLRGRAPYLDGAQRIARLVERYERDGFAYLDDGSGTYGITLSAPWWVLKQLEAYPDLRTVCYTERAWDDHQDAVACVKQPFTTAPG